jgi:hypothetical protein
MPIVGYRVLHNAPREHAAHVDYRSPCIAQILGDARGPLTGLAAGG